MPLAVRVGPVGPSLIRHVRAHALLNQFVSSMPLAVQMRCTPLFCSGGMWLLRMLSLANAPISLVVLARAITPDMSSLRVSFSVTPLLEMSNVDRV